MDEGGAAWRRASLLYLTVAAGGALGAVLRWLVALAFAPAGPADFPWATLVANGLGSFLICFFAHATGPEGRIMAGPRLRHFVMTGVLGGFTTFSIFSLEALRLMQQSAYATACAYVVGSVLTWLAAAWIGDTLARGYTRLNTTTRRRP